MLKLVGAGTATDSLGGAAVQPAAAGGSAVRRAAIYRRQAARIIALTARLHAKGSIERPIVLSTVQMCCVPAPRNLRVTAMTSETMEVTASAVIRFHSQPAAVFTGTRS